MNSSLLLYHYLLLNAWLLIGYGITRFLLSLSYTKAYLTQKQRLKLTRLAFLSVILMALFGAKVFTWIPIRPNLYFQLTPFLHKASTHFINNYQLLSWHKPATTFNISAGNAYDIALIFIVMGILISFYLYFKTIFSLQQLAKTSYQQHAIKGIYIMLSSNINIPCCLSIWRRAYVILPHSLLTEKNDFKFSLQHELQHLRQGDTKWLHLLAIFKCLCFLNPLLIWWTRWFNELHEFACDEALILRHKIMPADYGQCLVNVAKTAVMNHAVRQSMIATLSLVNHHSSVLLKRRIAMLFHYQNIKPVRGIFWFMAVTLIGLNSIVAYAMNDHRLTPLSTKQIERLLSTSDSLNELSLTATPEVVAEINQIRSNPAACKFMRASLKRMASLKPMLTTQLKQRHLPQALLALPLAESGYQALPENSVQSAGIWQFIPSTAQHYGLIVNAQYDERFNATKATQAALIYLSKLHTEFKDWNLAIMAYNQGENEIHRLIAETGKTNAWELIRTYSGNQELKHYLPSFHAAAIIMQYPGLINS